VAEFSLPAVREVAATDDLTMLVADAAADAPHHVLFSRRAGDRWQDVTAGEFHTEVVALAKGLIAAGVQPGDRVGLMSKTRYEWSLVDFAIWFAGAVTVPIYETSSAEQVEWILSDSGAVAFVVETDAHAAVFAEVRERVPDVAHLWQIDAGGLEALRDTGSGVDDAQVEGRRAELGASTLATVIYTSGTTGRPKGCELTHGNFLAESYNVVESTRGKVFGPNESTLLFLPLAHVFARAIQVGCVYARSRVGHTADVKNLLADLKTFQPTFILSVPRVFEKIYNSSEQKAEAAGKGKIFRAAADTAIAYSEALDHGGAGIGLRVKHGLFDKLVYSKLRDALGGRVNFAVSGGAPLGARLGHFFRGIGVTVLEGYGLTETAAGCTFNLPSALKIGTVGRPVPGTTIRTAEDGEVLVKGPLVYRGYWRNPGATSDSIIDGWFHTGDIGELDADGYLRITGRKKEILVTAGGKNVAPAVLEDRLRAHPLVSQCMVVGDAQPYVACLVTLDAEALPAWLEQHGKSALPAGQLTDDPDIVAEIQRAVDDANKAVSKAEAIKRFKILPVDFTEEGGQLTPTLKLKRNIVAKEFAGDIDALYS
jgi:long-chain acyl-CoA synthetase